MLTYRYNFFSFNMALLGWTSGGMVRTLVGLSSWITGMLGWILMKSFPVRQWVMALGVVFLPRYCLFVHGIGLTQTCQCRNSKDEPASARPFKEVVSGHVYWKCSSVEKKFISIQQFFFCEFIWRKKKYTCS